MQAIQRHRSSAEGLLIIDLLSPLPLTAKDFPTLLDLGLGRAVLYLQDHDDAPFQSQIAGAMWTNLAYDQQCEPHRADYLWDLIHASRKPSYYRDRLLQRLQRPHSSDYCTQMMHLAALFAQEGDDEMRTLFYQVFERFLLQEHTLLGEEALLALDGLEGYRRAARLMMAHPLQESENWQEGALFDQACATFSEAAVLELGNDDAALAAYTEHTRIMRATQKVQRKRLPVPPAPPYDELRRLLAMPRGQEGIRLPWARQLLPDVMVRLAGDMEREKDPVRLRRYLRLFRGANNQTILAPVLALTRHSDRMVVRHAVLALEEMTAPEVRARGEALLAYKADAEDVRNGLALLVANPAPDDYLHIQEALQSAAEQGQDALHAVNFPAREYFKANPAPERVPLLFFLYSNIACTLCRASAIEMLKEASALPEWLRAEARYDACVEVRALIGA